MPLSERAILFFPSLRDADAPPVSVMRLALPVLMENPADAAAFQTTVLTSSAWANSCLISGAWATAVRLPDNRLNRVAKRAARDLVRSIAYSWARPLGWD